MQSSAAEIEKTLSSESTSASEITRLLGGMVQKLQVLKRKVFYYIPFITININVIENPFEVEVEYNLTVKYIQN